MTGQRLIATDILRARTLEAQKPCIAEEEVVTEGRSMKTIAVLGGIGPQATTDFEARVHRESQRRVPAKGGSGYPPMVVHYYRRAPVLLDERGTPIQPLRLDPEFLRAAARLSGSGDFLVIPSNTPHLFEAEIERASGLEVLSIIEVTLAEVQDRGWKKVGVLGLGEPIVYTKRLTTMGLPYEILDPELRPGLDAAIFRLMEGREDDGSRRVAKEAVAALRGRGVDGIILGCTEIPLLLGADAEAADLVNPAELLARAAVSRALE
jgi:aspartate racemase